MISSKLIAERNKLGLSQTELADKLFVSQKSISKYERGTRRPSYEVLIEMASLFGCSVDYLLGRSPSPDASTPLPPKIAELVDAASGLSDEELDALLKILHSMSGNHAEQTK